MLDVAVRKDLREVVEDDEGLHVQSKIAGDGNTVLTTTFRWRARLDVVSMGGREDGRVAQKVRFNYEVEFFQTLHYISE